MSKWIDLTHPMQESMTSWTGRCGFHKEIKMDYPEGCRVMQFKMHAGIGTHIDAPCHFIPNGRSAADISLEELVVDLYVIDVSSFAKEDTLISVRNIEEFEKEHGKISPKSLVVAYTGWGKKWETDGYRNPDSNGKMHYPGFSKEAAEFLLKRDIRGLGIDTLSPDGPNVGYPVHEVILGAGRYIIENIAHLDKVPPVGAKAYVMPLKIVDGAEAPIRLVAYVPS